MKMKWKSLNKPFAGESRERGMTLIEIIIVVALLGTLMAYLVTSLTGQQDQARVDQARLAMGGIQQALQAYRLHNHRYPTTDQGLRALIEDPGNAKNWRGPYIEPNKLKDPWDNDFDYESDGSKIKIISGGIDLQLGTEDDVSYPKEESVSN